MSIRTALISDLKKAISQCQARFAPFVPDQNQRAKKEEKEKEVNRKKQYEDKQQVCHIKPYLINLEPMFFVWLLQESKENIDKEIENARAFYEDVRSRHNAAKLARIKILVNMEFPMITCTCINLTRFIMFSEKRG